MDVALVTYAGLPELDPDDRPLAAALAARGLEVGAVRWDDAGFDWGSTRMALLRSPWDYYRRYAEFLAWAERASAVTRLENPLPVLAYTSQRDVPMPPVPASVSVTTMSSALSPSMS